MSKVSRMCHITPLPPSVSREAAIAYLQNHQEMISLNPLVLRHERTTPHPNAEADEAQSMLWYAITDEIQYIPGTPLKGEVTYKAGFYDTAKGLQTHTFAPGGVELRGKWSVGGNAPGETPEEVEIGSNKPREGLYIQEEQELKCNILFTNFVKRNLKKSHSTVMDKIIQKAALPAESGKTLPSSSADSTRADHSRSASNNSASERSEHNGPKSSSSWSSTPTSYNQKGSNPCSCSMAAFGVHMETCRFYPRPRQSQSNPDAAGEQNDNLAMELDGNPVAAQHYHTSQSGRAAELE